MSKGTARRWLGFLSAPSARLATRPHDEPGPLLSAEGICKSFGGVAAVDYVNLSVQRGEFVGLVGPNGAGKTTLFNCICGQLRQDSGAVMFDGALLDGLPTHKREPDAALVAHTRGSR